MTFTSNGIHNLQSRRAVVQTKVRDVRADVTIKSLKHTQPLDHPQKVHKQFISIKGQPI